MVFRMQRLASILVVILMWTGLPGCGGGGGGAGEGTPNPSPGTGVITGTLRIPGVNATSTAALATVKTGDKDNTSQRDFVPGELLVQLKSSTDDDATLTHLLTKYAALGLSKVGRLYPEGPFRLRTNVFRDTTLSREDAKAKTESALRAIETEPSVERAGLNYLRYPQQITPIPNVRPDDPGYVNGYLWGQRLIDLPNAWGVATGRSDVVVAVLDTGIRGEHPEFFQRLVDGADFVKHGGLEGSGDGNGIDGDPTDVGPYPATGFHGTHVAGIIGAASNNGTGVSGVAWGIQIMPVRVLGMFGGGDADIVNGMRWAAGIPVPDAPPPPAVPAKVINMSLGGEGDCTDGSFSSLLYQDAIKAVLDRGVSIVVATGNAGHRGNAKETPASCPGVIAVAAVNYKVTRSYYSSFQDYVFIAAPGGDITDVTDGALGGILSPINVSGSSQPTYGFYQGTSMAAPHVAGVIALMHSAALDAGKALNNTEIMNILKSTALDLLPAGKDKFFGHGLIQAGAAVYQAKFGIPPSPSVVRPVPDPRPHSLFSHVLPPLLSLDSATITLHGAGGNRFFCYEVTPPNEPWLTVTAHDGAYHDITVKFNGSALPNGAHHSTIGVRVTADTPPGCSGGEEVETLKIPVQLVVGYSELPQRQDTVTVRAFGINPATQKMDKLGETQTSAAAGYRYRIPDLHPGRYYVEAGVDINGSGQFGDSPEEIYGKHGEGSLPEVVEVTTGQTENVDISIADGQSVYTFN